MAVAGSATSAYHVRVDGGQLTTIPTTSLSSLCAAPTDSTLRQLLAGAMLTVAGSDMAALWRMWGDYQVGDAAPVDND